MGGDHGDKAVGYRGLAGHFGCDVGRPLEHEYCGENRRKRDAADEQQPIRSLEPEQ
jgi:hypothetical protein